MKNILCIVFGLSFLVDTIGQSEFLSQLGGVNYGSFYTFIEDGQNGSLILFARNVEGKLYVFEVDSCGFFKGGKQIGDDRMEIHDYVRDEDRYILLGNFFGQPNSFFIIEFDLFSSSAAKGIQIDLGIPVIPNFFQLLQDGEKIITLDNKTIQKHIATVVRLSAKNEVLYVRSYEFDYNTQLDLQYYVTAHFAFDYASNKTALITNRHLTLLDGQGDITKVLRLRTEGAPVEKSRFLNMKPLLLDNSVYAVCENFQVSHKLIKIDLDEPLIAQQSESFYYKENLGQTFITISRSNRKNFLQMNPAGDLILLGEIDPVFENENPVIYKWDQELNMLERVYLDAGSPLVLGARALDDERGVFVFRRVGLELYKTSPGFEVNCFDQLPDPDPLGLNPKKLYLEEDTFPQVEELPAVVTEIEMPIQEISDEPNQTLLCQAYYGPPLPDIVIDTFICLGAEIDLKYTHPTGTVVWEDGSMDSLFHVTEPGVYRATVHHCGTTQQVVFNVPDGKCPCVFEVPNAFTPNGDGINDSFGPVYQCYFADYLLRVFNRWGQEVFTSTDPTQGWDGRIDGKEAPSEVYMWHATYTAWHEGQLFSRSASGEVTLLR
ncbi:MAG: gliding motility-associated C-terminal domain-containing protein [Bacteroidetes bacterium]|nr:MAG: gliding motility-associated C-terminal domain-containing protein [Bacteroidota bacterium]